MGTLLKIIDKNVYFVNCTRFKHYTIMKYLLILTSLLCVVQVTAQRKPKIKGNKVVTDYSESLPAFSAIELKDDLEIKLRSAAQESVEITADDNLIDVLKFRVEDSTLVISSFYNITRKKKLEITINYSYIESITLRDGRISTDGVLNTNELYVNTYEGAKLELKADAQYINVNMEGNSGGDFNLSGGEVNLVLKDRIDAKIYSVSDVNNIKMYKNASVKMEGSTNDLALNLMENAKFQGEKLEAGKVALTAQHSVTAEVNALEAFELTSSGSSKTHLYGNPSITILEFADTSELRKEK